MKLFRVWSVFSVLCCSTIVRAGSLSNEAIGVYGDSMSMQYSGWLPLAPEVGYSVFYNGTQLNWVDQLIKEGYNFGGPAPSSPEFSTYDAAIVGYTSP